MQASKALLLSNMLSSSESVEDAEIATFDASCVSTPDISVDLEPIQDLHGYDNPWPAGGGKNKCSMQDQTFVQYKEVEIEPIIAGTYIYSAVVTSDDTDINKCTIVFLDAEKTTIVSKVIDRSVGGARVSTSAFTASVPIKYVGLYASGGYPTGAGDTATFKDNMLEEGSTATTYAPYSNLCPISGRSEVNVYVEETYDPQATPKATIQLGQTVYGGTVDVTEGKLTVDRAMYAFDGTETNWNKSSSYRGSFYRSWSTIPSGNGMFQGAFICSHAGYVSNFRDYAYGKCASDSALNLWVMQDPDATTDDLKVYLTEQYENGTPVTVCYTLATPVEVTLTPQQIQTLVGENNVWSDSGNISVRNITCNADFLDLFLKLKLIGDC